MTDRPNNEQSLPPMSKGMRRFSMGIFFLLGVLLAAFVFGNPLGLSFLPGGNSGSAVGGAVPNAAAANASTGHAASGHEHLYQCPMHPEVIQNEPGNCPACGMPLVEMEDAAPPAAETLYQCPMHPEVIEPEPGSCPICGMPLVEMEETASGAALQIDPEQVQNLGVVSSHATVEDFRRNSETVGILDFNTENVTWVNTKFSGWIEEVYVSYVGQNVKRDEPLFEIYSPELVTSQQEYLRALAYRDSMIQSPREEALNQAKTLLEASRARLKNWDLTTEQIEKLEASGRVQRTLTVFAPADGVVTEVTDQALEGLFVRAGMNLYKLANLSTLWVHADVFERDLGWVSPGQRAEVRMSFDPDTLLRGKVLFLYPEVSSETRTLKVCVEIPNPSRKLRPGMYADVTLFGPTVKSAVLVPSGAVLRSGERNVIFVDLGNGKFEPREVTLGAEAGQDRLQILSGIEGGEAVVTQAQFMLDSESRVQEAIARMRR